MRMALEKKLLRVEVCDGGNGFTSPAPGSKAPAGNDAGGWGLYLVEELSDSWGIRRNGSTCVWFERTC